MSTRGVFIFADSPTATPESANGHAVYVHFDMYPEGAAGYLARCLESRMTWPLPRFEADEFAAGFVASVKADMLAGATAARGAGGNVRLSNRWDEAGDIAWAYLVTPDRSGPFLNVSAFPIDWDNTPPCRVVAAPPVYTGTVAGFLAQHGRAMPRMEGGAR